MLQDLHAFWALHVNLFAHQSISVAFLIQLDHDSCLGPIHKLKRYVAKGSVLLDTKMQN